MNSYPFGIKLESGSAKAISIPSLYVTTFSTPLTLHVTLCEGISLTVISCVHVFSFYVKVTFVSEVVSLVPLAGDAVHPVISRCTSLPYRPSITTPSKLHILDSFIFASKLKTLDNLKIFVGNPSTLNSTILEYSNGNPIDLSKYFALYKPDQYNFILPNGEKRFNIKKNGSSNVKRKNLII